MELFFKPMEFVYNLKYMGVGMVAIVAVIGAIIGVTVALNAITAKLKQKKDQ